LIIADFARLQSRFDNSGANPAGARLAPKPPMADPTPERARTLALHARAFRFTCGVINAYPRQRYLDDPSRIVWRELVKAAASSTFNLEEADAASSDADFISKMRIACREAKESYVAIRIIAACALAGAAAVGKYLDEANQLASIYSAIVRNKKANMKMKAPRRH
jgi:four helix bundle protein